MQLVVFRTAFALWSKSSTFAGASRYRQRMNQKIVGFHLDEENHWVADLECGHKQHVRHDPPWQERPWVITAEGRASRLGVELNCVRCEEMGAKVVKETLALARDRLRSAYEDAGVQGLCGDGRWEAALGSLGAIKPEEILDKALKGE